MLKEKIEMAISDITKILPEDLNILKEDLEKNLRATLNATFSKMEKTFLVSPSLHPIMTVM